MAVCVCVCVYLSKRLLFNKETLKHWGLEMEGTGTSGSKTMHLICHCCARCPEDGDNFTRIKKGVRRRRAPSCEFTSIMYPAVSATVRAEDVSPVCDRPVWLPLNNVTAVAAGYRADNSVCECVILSSGFVQDDEMYLRYLQVHVFLRVCVCVCVLSDLECRTLLM